MAQAVNNIAATFASCSISSKSVSPASSATPAPVSLPMTASMPGAAQSPSVSWNPQARLRRSLKSSLVGLYGGPGPKPMPSNPTKRRSSLKGLVGSGSTFRRINAAISVGDKLPDATFSYFDNGGDLQTITVSELTEGKKVVLLAVPGAFTPTCSQKHLPGFVEKASDLKAKGIDTIACISVNDAFVMKAWGEDLNVGDKVLLLADGNGDFTQAMGVTLDLTDKPVGLGIRSRRYALLAEDGVVKVLNLEEGGAFTVSGAEDILKVL